MAERLSQLHIRKEMRFIHLHPDGTGTKSNLGLSVLPNHRLSGLVGDRSNPELKLHREPKSVPSAPWDLISEKICMGVNSETRFTF